MANEHGRSAYLGNLGIWRELAREIRPAVDQAIARALDQYPSVEPWMANLSITAELMSLGPQRPEEDDQDDGPPSP